MELFYAPKGRGLWCIGKRCVFLCTSVCFLANQGVSSRGLPLRGEGRGWGGGAGGIRREVGGRRASNSWPGGRRAHGGQADTSVQSPFPRRAIRPTTTPYSTTRTKAIFWSGTSKCGLVQVFCRLNRDQQKTRNSESSGSFWEPPGTSEDPEDHRKPTPKKRQRQNPTKYRRRRQRRRRAR